MLGQRLPAMGSGAVFGRLRQSSQLKDGKHTHVGCRVHVTAFSVVPSRSGVVRTFQQRTLLEVGV